MSTAWPTPACPKVQAFICSTEGIFLWSINSSLSFCKVGIWVPETSCEVSGFGQVFLVNLYMGREGGGIMLPHNN